MSRLIDADALRVQMYRESFETNTYIQRWDSGRWISYKMFENAIDNAPTIEPQRMRGKWELHESKCGWVCTACGERDLRTTKFCPNCGAKMGETE